MPAAPTGRPARVPDAGVPASGFAWGNHLLDDAPPGEVRLDPAGQLAVRQVLARYAFALDHGDLDTLADVLADDVTWTAVIAAVARQGPLEGREAVVDLVREAARAETGQRRHHLTDVVLRRADQDAAVVWASLLVTSSGDGRATVATTGFLLVTVRRTEDGWRIARLLLGLDAAP